MRFLLVLLLFAAPAQAQLSDVQVRLLAQALVSHECPEYTPQGTGPQVCITAFVRLLLKPAAQQKAIIAEAVGNAKANALAAKQAADQQAADQKADLGSQATNFDGIKSTLNLP